MKKAFLFSILALSMNTFAQSNQQIMNILCPSLNSLEKAKGMLKDEDWKTSLFYSGKNREEALEKQLLIQSGLIKLYDSIYYWSWDTLNIGWNYKRNLTKMVYDANNNLTSCIGQWWNGFEWEDSYKYTNSFDVYNNWIGDLTQCWDGAKWMNISKYSYTYDANNNKTIKLFQNWELNTWLNSEKSSYTYDANNNQTSYLYQRWNDNAWGNNSKSIFTYDENNNMTSELEQGWDGSNWVNSSRDTCIFDANNSLLNYSTQFWDNNTWINNSQYIYTYDSNNNPTSVLEQNGTGSGWVDIRLCINTFDVFNNLTRQLCKHWNGSTWENEDYEMICAYDSNNNQISQLFVDLSGGFPEHSWQMNRTYDTNNFGKIFTYKHWKTAGEVMTSGDSTYYYFHTALGTNGLPAQNQTISIAPNPSNGTFNLSCINTMNTIEIYNLIGELIYSDFNFNHQISQTIDLSGSPKGIYLLKVKSSNGMYSRKIVIQ